jgi:spore coat-associated protein N
MDRYSRNSERRRLIASRRRKFFAAAGLLAATIVLASAFLVASGADFTTSSANPANVFTSGKLTHTNSAPSAILSMSKMKPGDVQTGSVTIKNTGDLSGAFTLSMVKTDDVVATNAGAGHLFDVLKLKIEDAGTVVYNGNLKDFTSKALGVYAAGDSHTYDFTVTFPNGGTPGSNTTGDNIYQGSSTTVEFDWAAVQS